MLLLLALTSYTPKIKWWQTEVAVSFNVLADCTTTPEVELEPPVADEEKPGDGERGVAGGFRFKCTDALFGNTLWELGTPGPFFSKHHRIPS